MARRLLLAAGVAALVLVGLAPAAGASTTIALAVPQSTAFGVLGHSCGGIQEQSFATGFDTTSGLPAGDVYLQTRCGGSGRGGGYHVTTYAAWVAVTWYFSGAVESSTKLGSAPAVDPAFSATDASGNEVYNTLNAVNVLPANCTVDNTTYCAYRAYLVVQSTFVATPVVTSVLLAAGPASGGSTVTINGTALTGATAVDFGTTPAASFTVNGDTSITAVTPAAAAGTVDVTVTSAGGTSLPSSADQYTFVAAPAVAGLSPASGPIAGGTAVTVAGSAFTGATGVSFGGTPASFTVDSDTSITAIAPAAEAPDTVDVTVSSAGGTSALSTADQFAYTTAAACTGPCVSIGDAAILEGDTGSRMLKLAVTLSQPATSTVTVQYATTDGTATGGTTAGPGVDFKAKAGTVTFLAGPSVVKWVSIPVFGDTTFEPDETFSVTLANPTPPYSLGRASGTGTILNDDGIATGTTAGVGDAALVKTTAGDPKLVVPVTLSAPATATITFTYDVQGDTAAYSSTAAGGGDFGGKTTGTVTFLAGSSKRFLTIPAWHDPSPDTDESFTISITPLSVPTTVTVVRAEGTGTIFGP